MVRAPDEAAVRVLQAEDQVAYPLLFGFGEEGGVLGGLGGRRGGGGGREDVESGDDEEAEAHAGRVVGGVGCGEEGFEAAGPVAGVAGDVEGFVFGGGHF